MVSPRRIARIAVKLGRDSSYPMITWDLAKQMTIQIWALHVARSCCSDDCYNGFNRVAAKRMCGEITRELFCALNEYCNAKSSDDGWVRSSARDLLAASAEYVV